MNSVPSSVQSPTKKFTVTRLETLDWSHKASSRAGEARENEEAAGQRLELCAHEEDTVQRSAKVICPRAKTACQCCAACVQMRAGPAFPTN